MPLPAPSSVGAADPQTSCAADGGVIVIGAGDYTATLSEAGAAVTDLRYGRRELLCHHGPMPPFRGVVLAPWPNRIVDGHYRWGGSEHQLPVNEPERRAALHGLVYGARWRTVAADGRSAELTCSLAEQPGYPWPLELRARYELDEERGLEVDVVARNHSLDVIPLGVGIHPYLTPGAGTVDEWTLRLDAAQVLDVDPERLRPRGLRPVEEAGFDFRGGHRVGAAAIDHAFTGLAFDRHGEARVELRNGAGDGVAIVWDDRCPWVQVFTADRAGQTWHRRGVAIEPMTCPPNAFNSAGSAVGLQAGEERGATWRIVAVEAGS